MKVRIEEILKKYGIQRQAYHGGDMVGNHIRLLMEHTEKIEGARDIRRRLY